METNLDLHEHTAPFVTKLYIGSWIHKPVNPAVIKRGKRTIEKIQKRGRNEIGEFDKIYKLSASFYSRFARFRSRNPSIKLRSRQPRNPRTESFY